MDNPPETPIVKNTSTSTANSHYQAQKNFFAGGATFSYEFRRKQLILLKKVVQNHESEILQALALDIGKPLFEGYASEIGIFYEEINVALKNLKHWMEPKKVSAPISSWPSKSCILVAPKGVALIIGPWNYPFQLLLVPLVAAMAAGNTAILKAPEQTPHVSRLVEKMISENFEGHYLAVVQGDGKQVVSRLMENRFDHVFFTGSIAVGKKIAEMAAPHLSPVTLELGGKSPCIVDKSANLKVAARRIAFGKWLNAGQTCVAPDYLLVHQSIKEEFLKELEKTVGRFYGEEPLQSKYLANIINQGHFENLAALLSEGKILFGGKSDAMNLRIEPTVILNPPLDGKLMEQEIFGPILPVITWAAPEEIFEVVAQNPYPLSFYFFGKNRELERDLVKKIQFGGGAINNTIVHLSNPRLPFGGVGSSGYGNYHGKAGFETFSHYKSIIKTATWFDLKLKYPPYSDLAYKLVKKIMK